MPTWLLSSSVDFSDSGWGSAFSSASCCSFLFSVIFLPGTRWREGVFMPSVLSFRDPIFLLRHTSHGPHRLFRILSFSPRSEDGYVSFYLFFWSFAFPLFLFAEFRKVFTSSSFSLPPPRFPVFFLFFGEFASYLSSLCFWLNLNSSSPSYLSCNFSRQSDEGREISARSVLPSIVWTPPLFFGSRSGFFLL